MPCFLKLWGWNSVCVCVCVCLKFRWNVRHFPRVWKYIAPYCIQRVTINNSIFVHTCECQIKTFDREYLSSLQFYGWLWEDVILEVGSIVQSNWMFPGFNYLIHLQFTYNSLTLSTLVTYLFETHHKKWLRKKQNKIFHKMTSSCHQIAAKATWKTCANGVAVVSDVSIPMLVQQQATSV